MGTELAILLVEPDWPTRALYRRELSTQYRVFSLPDQHTALDLSMREGICAAVVEPALPEGAGWELVAALHAAGIPVIVCSVLDDRRRGRELGVSIYLVKPVLPTTLLEALRCVLVPAGEQYPRRTL